MHGRPHLLRCMLCWPAMHAGALRRRSACLAAAWPRAGAERSPRTRVAAATLLLCTSTLLLLCSSVWLTAAAARQVASCACARAAVAVRNGTVLLLLLAAPGARGSCWAWLVLAFQVPVYGSDPWGRTSSRRHWRHRANRASFIGVGSRAVAATGSTRPIRCCRSWGFGQ
eukprot:COSAG01_NODE_12705_length_1697_cov_1.588235_3_plen_170_part_00